VIGDCNPDVLVSGDDIAPVFGQHEKLADSITLAVGGSAAITAVAATRLGLRVALVAAVGDDAAGTFMLGQLSREGVDTSAVVVRPGVRTGMTVVASRGSDRAILTATGAIATLSAADVPAWLIASARHVHVSSYFLVERSLGPGLAGLLAQARQHGARTSLDTNWDPAGRWDGGRLAAILGQTDFLLPNEAEALHLASQADLGAAVAALAGPARTVVVKLGARGALCVTQTVRYRLKPPPVTAVDTTGAGDCFNAGLIAGLLGGRGVAEAAALGCAVGAASVTALGGTAACPDLAAAQALARKVAIRTLTPGS
jgi:sugar/nucleoside kinase (ribokinase family)